MRFRLLLPLAALSLAAAVPATTHADGAPPLLYVANRGGHAVSAYDPSASGAVDPVLTIAGDSTNLSDPWGLAFAADGSLYVQNYLSEAKTAVFAPGASGDAEPSAVMRGPRRDAPSVAVDSAGYVYVARLQTTAIEVFAPGTTTDPVYVIVPGGSPRSLAVNANDELIVAVVGTSAGLNTIRTYTPAAQGQPTESRRIGGAATLLGRSTAWGGFSGDSVVLTYSPYTDRIYAAVSGCSATTQPAHISVFPTDGVGNIAPIRTITGLGATAFISGIAGNQQDGSIYAMVTTGCGGGTGVINAYDRFADGDEPPLHSFTDATTNFADVREIAFAPF